MNKKMKVTIEQEGKPPRVIEANGMAAAFLTDGKTENDHGMTIAVCGNMSVTDLMYLRDGVGEELIEAVENAIIEDASPRDLVKLMLWLAEKGGHNESKR